MKPNPFEVRTLCLATLLAIPFVLTAAAATASGPNILLIIADDLRPEMGCYGIAAVQTPHVDRFAEEALLFERAYCQQAVCRSSRLSFLSGLRPHERRIWTNRDVRSSFQDIDFLPAHFGRHGYQTIGFGKIAHNGEEDPRCWSVPHRMPKNAGYEYRTKAGRALVNDIRDKAVKAGQPDPFRDIPEKIQRGMAWESLAVSDQETGDGQIADLALAALDRVRGKRFFLAAGFLRPHLPFVAPKKYWDLYDPDKLPAAAPASPPKGSPRLIDNRSRELLLQYRRLPQKLPLDRETERQLVHGYYACVSFIDAQIGRLLEGLASRGLAENTIVVITSDHGFQLGDHGMWGKATNFERSTRVPLLVRVPGSDASGKRTTSLVEIVGLYPTLCELAGLSKPKHLQGSSFATLFDNPELALRQTAFSQYSREGATGLSIRTKDFRYTEWRDIESNALRHTELYDHRKNSREEHNLAGAQAFAKQVRRLSGLLAQGRENGVYQ